MIPLEDGFNDLIQKAQRGLGLSNQEICTAADISEAQLQALKDGTLLDTELHQVAKVLQLHGSSLAQLAKGTWSPSPIELPGLAQFNTVFDDMTVNAYLIWDCRSREAIAFDSGANSLPIVQFLQTNNLKLQAVYLTHTHPDHVTDLSPLLQLGAKLYANHDEPWSGAELFHYGFTSKCGQLEISTRKTSGHSIAGTTYVISGLQQKVAIVGDALFAASMGGGAISYSEALQTNRESIFTLDNATIICPGHGPMTTVGEEKQFNPFYPEFKSL